jgi:hypothetical protein
LITDRSSASTDRGYADVDPAAHRLFVAHMGDGVLLALDTDSGAVTATVPNLPTVTGQAVARCVPECHEDGGLPPGSRFR